MTFSTSELILLLFPKGNLVVKKISSSGHAVVIQNKNMLMQYMQFNYRIFPLQITINITYKNKHSIARCWWITLFHCLEDQELGPRRRDVQVPQEPGVRQDRGQDPLQVNILLNCVSVFIYFLFLLFLFFEFFIFAVRFFFKAVQCSCCCCQSCFILFKCLDFLVY